VDLWLNSGINMITLGSRTDLPPGLYLIRVTRGTEQIVTKVIKAGNR
jgi:hypothetical protein